MIGALLGGSQAGTTARHLRGRDRWLWLGGLLLAGAIVVLATGLFVFIFGAALLPQAWLADLAADASTLARGLMQAFVQQLALRSLIAGGLWFGVAIAVLIWGSSRPVRRY